MRNISRTSCKIYDTCYISFRILLSEKCVVGSYWDIDFRVVMPTLFTTTHDSMYRITDVVDE